MSVEMIPADGQPVLAREIATLFGWPELTGYVVLAIEAEDDRPMLVASNTASSGQMIGLLCSVAATLGRQIHDAGEGIVQ